ncbi:MAG: MGH1-like glycoside hydrolase domain-containing protein [Actinomycetes bacterium]
MSAAGAPGTPYAPSDPERLRLREADEDGIPWRRWGPYVAARKWGTVPEDYSAGGDAWSSFPHDHARSRAYRWAEDGMAAVCDEHQRLCLGLALWNGVDPILKERMFGLTGDEGNHGEDVKEYWWYLDSTPTHSWMRWRYHYPQSEYPYAGLVAGNRGRSRLEPELELLDTGAFDQGYWQVTVDHGKASPDDLLMRIRVRNVSPQRQTLHVLPTMWFRNTWDWSGDETRPSLHGRPGLVEVEHPTLGRRVLSWSGTPDQLFCENVTNLQRLYGVPGTTRYPKDGINDHVVAGSDTVNPEQVGTKCALWYRLDVEPGEVAEIRLRLAEAAADVEDGFTAELDRRENEADAFYAPLAPDDASADERRVMRQAFGGLLWSKQYYHFDVARWLDGDPGQPPPPEQRRHGRDSVWRHLSASDVIVMPDDWEYPWFAAWDLAFHAITLAHVDPAMAKQQLLLLTHEWYMNSRGQLPAYEWEFSDVNPPVHAVAALRVFGIDGSRDVEWLTEMFNKLLVNFTWWMNREDVDGRDVFAGGFLGLDNIAPFDRDKPPPDLGGRLVEVDGTAWVAQAELALLAMALILADRQPGYGDVAVTFFEHFWAIASSVEAQGLWDEQDGLFYSVVQRPDGGVTPIRAHSIDGMLPLVAFAVPPVGTLDRLPEMRRRVEWYLQRHGGELAALAELAEGGPSDRHLMSVFGRGRLERVLRTLFDSQEFLSPYGIRAVSRWHADHPLDFDGAGRLDYEPGESTTAMFGGNSNWRGPIWFPMNYLLIEALARLDLYFGTDLMVEVPTGSGQPMRLLDASRELGRRLVSIFTEDAEARRPVFGDYATLQDDPEWHDLLPFHEYFHGDTGAGLGASHQTGWTALVADLITSRRFPQYVSTHLATSSAGDGLPRARQPDDRSAAESPRR